MKNTKENKLRIIAVRDSVGELLMFVNRNQAEQLIDSDAFSERILVKYGGSKRDKPRYIQITAPSIGGHGTLSEIVKRLGTKPLQGGLCNGNHR